MLIVKIKQRLQRISLIAMLLALTACGTPNSVSIKPAAQKISGSFNVGDFAVKRVQLDIDGFNSKRLALNKTVEPTAVIYYQGVGVLQAHWLIDGQIKERINITLNRGSILTLKPKFSLTSKVGRHLIQLSIIQPSINFKTPEITVFVTQ